MANIDHDMIAQEAEHLISEMEEDGYEFPEEFSRRDWTLAIICIIVSGLFTIAGAFF